MRSLPVLLTLVGFVMSQTGCLKTRAQLRQENGDENQTEEGAPQAGRPPTGSYQIEEIKGEIARLSGKVEELEHTQKSSNLVGLQEALTKLDSRIGELEQNQVLVMSELKAIKDEQTQKKTREAEAAEVRSRPKDVLSQGKSLLDQKKYEEAAEVYRKALSAGLNNKDQAEANFGLGTALYGLKDYKKAIVSLSKVQELNSKSPKVPASLWLIGRGFEHLNMNREARGFYSELIEKFPKSSEAKKARERIKNAKGAE